MAYNVRGSHPNKLDGLECNHAALTRLEWDVYNHVLSCKKDVPYIPPRLELPRQHSHSLSTGEQTVTFTMNWVIF